MEEGKVNKICVVLQSPVRIFYDDLQCVDPDALPRGLRFHYRILCLWGSVIQFISLLVEEPIFKRGLFKVLVYPPPHIQFVDFMRYVVTLLDLM